MKTIPKELKSISLLLGLLIFFQSCRVYYRESVTLDQAVKEQKRVKVKTKDDKIYKFRKVVFENGKFYGITKTKGKELKSLIEKDELKKVRLHNKTLSIIYGIGITVVTTFVIAFIIFLSSFDLDLDLNFNPPM